MLQINYSQNNMLVVFISDSVLAWCKMQFECVHVLYEYGHIHACNANVRNKWPILKLSSAFELQPYRIKQIIKYKILVLQSLLYLNCMVTASTLKQVGIGLSVQDKIQAKPKIRSSYIHNKNILYFLEINYQHYKRQNYQHYKRHNVTSMTIIAQALA